MNTGRKWLARLIVGFDVLIWCSILMFEPLSVMDQVVDHAGTSAHVAFLGLVTLGLIAIADVVVNDLMPERYCLRGAIRHRHFIYMLMCLGCLSTIFVIIKSIGFSVVVFHYGLIAAASLTIALLDVRDRVHYQKTL